MKINFTKISITFLLIIFISTLSFLIIESELNPSTIKDISVLTYSTFTLIIALLLFDRFDYRKKVFDKKLSIVLELIQFLKKTTVGISQKSESSQYAGGLFIDREKIFNFKKREMIDFNSSVVFNINDVIEYFNQIELFRNNPFMPKEINKSLSFIGEQIFVGNPSKDLKYFSNFTKISLNKSQDFFKLENCSLPESKITFNEFLDLYIKCLNEIENWINKHSNFKSDLNF